MWNAERALAQIEGRPTNLASNEIAERLAACQSCKHRIGGHCKPARTVITVHALRQQNRCPLARWPGSAPKPIGVQPKQNPRVIYPKAEPRSIDRLAAVTCHYNPCGYKLLEDNYHRFVRALSVDLELWTVELAYGDEPFRLPDGPRMLRVRGDARHVLWQKERMLNLGIDALPPNVDAVAWLDADLIWFNRNWVEEAKRLLERYNVVQLFEHVIDTDGYGRVGQKSPGHVHAKTHGLGYGRPGGGWAARREAIACGLYDRHVIGGGDTAVLLAWEGRQELPPSLQIGMAWEEHYRAWAIQSFDQVRKALVCVPGDVLHLYHGTRQNRQYVERYKILHENAYDPVHDVEIDLGTGLLQWTATAQEQKLDLVRRVAEYFERRREDE